MKRFAKIFTIGLMSLTVLMITGSSLWAASQLTASRDIVAAQTAAQLYEQGNYALAAQSYQQLIDRGHADPVIYYNLGLAYEQAGDLGRAVWSLRNAEQLAPRDADVQAARAQLQSILAETNVENAMLATRGQDFLAQVSTTSAHWLTLDELSWLTLALWTIFAVMLLTVMFIKPGKTVRQVAKVIAISSGALLLVAMLGMGARIVDAQQPPAIVVAEQVTLAAGPGAQYGGALALRSGSEVSVIDQRGEWVEVSAETASGAVTGWLPADATATIVSSNMAATNIVSPHTVSS